MSVIIATYNAEKYVRQCLSSCVSQTVKPEILIFDGGSTDATLEIAREFSSHIAHLHTGRDAGIYDAWNKALRQATGDYVIFLGADDYFLDEKTIEDVISQLNSFGELPDILYGVTLYGDASGRVDSIFGGPWDQAEPFKFSKMVIPPPSSFFKRELFEKYGDFDTSYSYVSDLEFLMRVFARGVTPRFFDRRVTYMLKGGFSSKHEIAGYLEIARIRKSIGLSPVSRVTGYIILRAFFFKARKQAYNFLVRHVVQRAARRKLFGPATERVVELLPIKE